MTPSSPFSSLTLLKLLFSLALLALVFLAVQWGVQRFKNPNQMGVIESMVMDMTIQVPPGETPVETEILTPQAFSAKTQYTGEAKAYNDTPIYPRVEGWLVSLPVYPGDTVRKGQLLAKLDSDELTSRYQAALFTQQHSQDAINAAKANLNYWASEIKRAEALVADDVITREEYEREQSQFESARAQYQQMQSQNQANQARQNTQAIQLGYTRLVAPFEGVITKRNVDKGVLVRPGMEILRLAQLSPIRIQAHIAESDFSKIKVGQRAWIGKTTGSDNQSIETTITSVFPNKDLATRTAVVEALLPNSNHDFVPGDFVTLTIESNRLPNTLSVPQSAITITDRNTAVWVVQEGKAHLRYVTTGNQSYQRVEIYSGLSKGDHVIIRGHQNLMEGQSVITVQPTENNTPLLLPKNTHAKTRLSKANHYQIKSSLNSSDSLNPLGHWLLTARLQNPPATVGENKIQLELTPLHGQPNKDLSIEAQAVMPAMAKMRVPKPSIYAEKTGVYTVKSDFTMPGLWQIHLTIWQGKKRLGESTLEVEVPR